MKSCCSHRNALIIKKGKPWANPVADLHVRPLGETDKSPHLYQIMDSDIYEYSDDAKRTQIQRKEKTR